MLARKKIIFKVFKIEEGKARKEEENEIKRCFFSENGDEDERENRNVIIILLVFVVTRTLK